MPLLYVTRETQARLHVVDTLSWTLLGRAEYIPGTMPSPCHVLPPVLLAMLSPRYFYSHLKRRCRVGNHPAQRCSARTEQNGNSLTDSLTPAFLSFSHQFVEATVTLRSFGSLQDLVWNPLLKPPKKVSLLPSEVGNPNSTTCQSAS